MDGGIRRGPSSKHLAPDSVMKPADDLLTAVTFLHVNACMIFLCLFFFFLFSGNSTPGVKQNITFHSSHIYRTLSHQTCGCARTARVTKTAKNERGKTSRIMPEQS